MWQELNKSGMLWEVISTFHRITPLSNWISADRCRKGFLSTVSLGVLLQVSTSRCRNLFLSQIWLELYPSSLGCFINVIVSWHNWHAEKYLAVSNHKQVLTVLFSSALCIWMLPDLWHLLETGPSLLLQWQIFTYINVLFFPSLKKKGL